MDLFSEADDRLSFAPHHFKGNLLEVKITEVHQSTSDDIGPEEGMNMYIAVKVSER